MTSADSGSDSGVSDSSASSPPLRNFSCVSSGGCFSGSFGFVISSSDKWLQIIYTNKDAQNSEANLVFAKPTSLYDKNSELFKEQYKEKREYKGYRFGIRVDRNEIGLYDYALNQLKAKYVYNFAPDPAYYDSANGVISAYFDINLLDGILPGDSDYEILK